MVIKTGDTVVLIRHPHGGTFEIPVLKVNNNYKPGKELIGRAPDAVYRHVPDLHLQPGHEADRRRRAVALEALRQDRARQAFVKKFQLTL